MADPGPIVIGLTGAFGSGCTTAAKNLRDSRNFIPVRLSDVLRSKWKEAQAGKEPSRSDLQRLGDDLRQGNHPGILVEVALAELAKANKGNLPPNIAFDGIRNVGEIEYLRERFGYHFTLIAILATADARWNRIGTTAYTDKGLGKTDFIADDQRDKNEETEYGQQVELCLDKADILLDNSDDVALGDYISKILEYVDLVTGKKLRGANEKEIAMNIAYASSHSSKCLKRHVGAVIVDEKNQVISTGYNENPLGTNPCVEEPEYKYNCFRDIVRNNHFERLCAIGGKCPVCGGKLEFRPGPPWRCSACAAKAQKTNLEEFFFPDRAISWCTAVHAEVWAILSAGGRARGGTLYSTTFPCFQCAEKLIQAGIAKVVFTEAYPDPFSAKRLRLAEIELEQFEGVRSASFDRIFSRLKPI